MSETLWALSRDEFEWFAEEWTAKHDDQLVVRAEMGVGGTPPTALDESQNMGYIYDFQYPLELFVDGSTGIEHGEHRVGHYTITETFVDAAHETVQTQTSYFDDIRALMDEVGGPDTETAVIFGVFGTQTGGFRMTGNSESGTYRLASARFDADALSGDMAAIRAASTTIAAPLVVPMDELVPEAQAYARDEENDFEFIDRGPEMEAEEVLDVLRDVDEGDRIRINDRERPLTVVPKDESSEVGFYGKRTVFLLGNGTDYRIAWDDDSPRTRRPKLKWRSDSEHIETVEIVERSGTNQPEVSA